MNDGIPAVASIRYFRLLVAYFLSDWRNVTRYIIGIWDIEVNRGFADQVTIVNSKGQKSAGNGFKKAKKSRASARLQDQSLP